MDELVVGLDIGSSKVCCMICARQEDGRLKFVGFGSVKSEGIRAGVIVNLRSAIKAVTSAVEKAEASGYEIRQIVVGLSGGAVEGINSRGVAAILGQREITDADVDHVLEAAKAVLIPTDREILHVIPQEYIVDDVRKIKEPVAMMGIRLEVEAHVVTTSIAVSRNLIQCINGAGFSISEIVLGSLACGTAVLSKEEKSVGVLLLDIGAGTTDVVLFFDGAPRFSKVYSLGSDRITKDVAQVLQIPEDEAERLKLKYGCTWIEGITEDEEVIVRGVGSRPPYAMRRSQLGRIMQARMEEILTLVARDVGKTGLLPQLGAGVVFTGGGSYIEGLPELSKRVFGKPGRMGVPLGRGGLPEVWQRPEFSSCVGLALWGKEVSYDASPVKGSDKPKISETSKKSLSEKVEQKRNKVWDFIKKNFI